MQILSLFFSAQLAIETFGMSRSPLEWSASTESFLRTRIDVRWGRNLQNTRSISVGLDFADRRDLYMGELSIRGGYRESMVARVSLPNTCETNSPEFEYSLTVIGGTNDVSYSALDLSPEGALSRRVESFMLTPTEFIINAWSPENECESELVRFQAKVMDQVNLWMFINANNNEPVIIGDRQSSTLTETDFLAFTENIAQVLNENGIRFSRGYGEKIFIHDCNNMDFLESILPVLQYNLQTLDRETYPIELSAKEYLSFTPRSEIRSSPELAGSCTVNVAKMEQDEVAYLGASLFRKYAVVFNSNETTARICLARR